MISATMIALYMIATFAVGAVGTLVLFLWLIGSSARTIGIAHMFGDPIVQTPTNDRRWKFERIKNVDEKGRYLRETDGGQMRAWKIDPEDVYIEGGKAPLVVCLKELVTSINPLKATAAEAAEASGSDKEKVEWAGISVDWAAVKRKIGEVVSPSHYASMWSSSMEGNRPLEPPSQESGIDTGTALKIGGLATVVIVIIVGIFVASKMGVF